MNPEKRFTIWQEPVIVECSTCFTEPDSRPGGLASHTNFCFHSSYCVYRQVLHPPHLHVLSPCPCPSPSNLYWRTKWVPDTSIPVGCIPPTCTTLAGGKACGGGGDPGLMNRGLGLGSKGAGVLRSHVRGVGPALYIEVQCIMVTWGPLVDRQTHLMYLML